MHILALLSASVMARRHWETYTVFEENASCPTGLNEGAFVVWRAFATVAAKNPVN